MRRQARKLSRNGIQPMMMLSADDKFPEVATVMTARWAWRYRSELGPLLIAAVTMLTAAVLHATHPVWPGIILAVTLATSGGLTAFGKRLGLPSLAERLYAVTVTAADGTWLTVATAAGPLRSPFPQLLVIGTGVLAIPWWVSHRRRARVRVERKLESWPEIAQSVGLAGSRVMSAVVDVWGWRARIGLARGQTIADVLAKLPAIESALGTVRGAARALPTPDNRAHRFELRVLEIDPHADAIPWPGPSVATIAEPIDLGPFEDASPARVLLLRRHALIGGIAGSGKSGGINVMMGNLSACRDVVIWAIDLKRGMELAPWHRALTGWPPRQHKPECCFATRSRSSKHAPRCSRPPAGVSGYRRQTCPLSSSSSMSTPSWPTTRPRPRPTPIPSPAEAVPWRSRLSPQPSARPRKPWAEALSDPRWTSASASESVSVKTSTSSWARAC